MSDTLTPIAVEATLRDLVTTLTQSQQALSDARDAEVNAKHAYEAARRAALLSSDRPRVERGGTTTAERDAWVDEQCAEQRRVYDVAEATRKAAEDHLRVTRDQASVMQTLARSVQQAFSMAGTGGA